MVSTDPIADMLSRIRNAIAVSKHEVILPHSGVKERVVGILSDNGFLVGSSVSDAGSHKIMRVVIAKEGTNPNISSIKRLSRPGQRRYVGSDKIPSVKRGRGIVVISTSQGLMTGDEAKAKKLGGELICEVF